MRKQPRIPVLLTALLTLGVTQAGSAVADPPIVTSDNVELVWTVPSTVAMSSVAFASDAPIAYASTFHGLQVFDISNPERPQLIGHEPLVGWSNEALSLGERDSGEKFVLFASNQAAADTTGYVNPTNRVVTVVEVTDPANPEIVGHVETPTRTHTASCGTRSCEYAYTDGRTQGEISIVDLTDFRDPQVAGTFQSVVPLGHDQDLDEAGILWHAGGQGTVALDISDPTNPVQLNSTSEEGVVGNSHNRFIHHNSYRPNATAFRRGGPPSSRQPDIRNGNVLLVTEEFLGTNLNTPDCPAGDGEGQFQTWHIPWLDANRYNKRVNPDGEFGAGTITPLATWNTELVDSGITLRVPGFCSAHYFDFHEAGVVAQGFYEQGTRILDVRDATDIKQVGYFFAPGMETWAAYWVPEYDDDGAQTGRDSSIVYTADNARGMDILRVDLDGLGEPEQTENLVAPILAEWLTGAGASSGARFDPDYGFVCRLL